MRICILLAIWGIATPWLACGENINLQLKWTHQFQSAGFYAAIEKGYYRDEGLEVTLKEGGPHVNFAAELKSGRAQYVVSMPSMLIHRYQGSPVVALAAIFQHSPEVLIVPANSEIDNPHQLFGKRIMMSIYDTPAIPAMLVNEGITQEDIDVIPYDFQLAQLKSGEIDAISGYSSTEPFFFPSIGVSRALAPAPHVWSGFLRRLPLHHRIRGSATSRTGAPILACQPARMEIRRAASGGNDRSHPGEIQL